MATIPLSRLSPLLAALAVALAACTATGWRQPLLELAGRPQLGLSQEELAAELHAFASHFGGLVSTAGEEISASSDDPTHRRRALLFSLRMNPAMEDAAFLPNPMEGYVRALTVTVMLHRYLATGDGRELFGDAQPIAVGVAETLEEEAYALGARFLGPEQLREVRREVTDLAERFPIRGTQFSLAGARQAVLETPRRGALSEVISLPLAPFRALQGVDTGAAAIRDFNQTARRIGTMVAGLPAELRGEMQLLLFDAEELRSLQEGLAAFELAAASAERASLAMERMPEELRALLGEEVRALLEESQQPVARAADAVDRAAEIAPLLEATATQIREASGLWREVLGENDPTPPGPDERPFDVREWESTARAIGTSAAELRALAAELQNARGALDALSLGAALDRLFWRGLALLVAFFALLLAYRLLAARLVPRSRAGA